MKKKCPNCSVKVEINLMEMASGMKDLSCQNCGLELQMNAGFFQSVPAILRVGIMVFIIMNAKEILFWISGVDFGSISSLILLPFLIAFFFAEYLFLPLQDKKLLKEKLDNDLEFLENFETTSDIEGAVTPKERQEAMLKSSERKD